MLYVDLRGHGRSDISASEHWNLDTWADDLAGLLDALGLDQVVLIAVGWGTYPGIRFATRHPERIAKAVLINPVARFLPARAVAAFDRSTRRPARPPTRTTATRTSRRSPSSSASAFRCSCPARQACAC